MEKISALPIMLSQQKLLPTNIFVNFRKVYSSIWRKGLFDKLVQLRAYLPNSITNPFTPNTGLKQGCNLKSILFNLFIHDINNIFNNNLCQPPKIYQLKLLKAH